jgi:hypothetical protein
LASARAAARLIAGKHAGRKDLDGDDAFELLVAGTVDGSHAPGAERLDDNVTAELVAGDQDMGDGAGIGEGRGWIGTECGVVEEVAEAVIVGEKSDDGVAQLWSVAECLGEIGGSLSGRQVESRFEYRFGGLLRSRHSLFARFAIGPCVRYGGQASRKDARNKARMASGTGR